MSMPNISSRDYICWKGSPPSEPTSTLVLTSKNNYYVDLRIFKPYSADEPELPNTGGPIRRLEWGFAGLSESWATEAQSTPLNGGEGVTSSPSAENEAPKSKNARWLHWVDSRVPLTPTYFGSESVAHGQHTGGQSAQRAALHDDDPFVDATSPTFSTADSLSSGASATVSVPPLKNFLPVTDGGVLHPVPDDPELTLETGAMVNPVTGVLTPYKEMWRDVAVTAADVESEQEAKYSVVLTLEMPEICARGMVVRLGQWCQAILMIGAQITVERWEFVWKEGKGDTERDGDWTRRVRLGDGFLPVGVAFRAKGVKLGDLCRQGDMVWVVRERFEWSE